MRWQEQRFNEAMRELDDARRTHVIGREEYRRRRRVMLDAWDELGSTLDADDPLAGMFDTLDAEPGGGRDTVRRAVPHAVSRQALDGHPDVLPRAQMQAVSEFPLTEFRGSRRATENVLPTQTPLSPAMRASRRGGMTLALWITFAAVAIGSALAYWLTAA